MNWLSSTFRWLTPLFLLVALPPSSWGEEPDLAKELPRISGLDVDAALRSFRIHEGFRLDVVAAEPVVMDPVSVCYDADGRIYVAEMRGYPYPEKSPTGNIRRLEDRDGDGRYEFSQIFVPDLSWPTAVLPYDGGIFIAVAPDILYAKDTNGDGVADVKRVMFSGFGTQNVQGLINGLLWGTDGWIYGVSGGNGGDIKNLTQPSDAPVSVRSRDFRFKPDGSKFEVISGGGQFGHTFDDWGHRFTSNNSNHIRQIVFAARYLDRNPALASHEVLLDIPAEGPAAPVYRISPPEPWRIVRTRQRAADPDYVRRLPPTELVATGFFTSATGVTIYRGSAYSEDYRGNAFIGDVGGNLVHRKRMSQDGSHYKATRADEKVEFLASTDNWFRPVNFTNTPDGTLLILDMYRETIEHPFSIPEPIKKHLDLTSGKDRGRLYSLVPTSGVKHRRPALSEASTAALVDLLGDPDAWWRETAQRLLIERHDPKAPALLKQLVLARPNGLGRAHALWVLNVLGGLEPELILAGFKDTDPRVREQAALLTEGKTGKSPELIAALVEAARDEDAMTRFQVALSLGEVQDSRVLAALAEIAVRDAKDSWTRNAVMSGLSGRTLAFLDALVKSPGFSTGDQGRVWLEDLAFLIGAEGKSSDAVALLERYTAPGASDDPSQVGSVLRGLGRGLQRSGGSIAAIIKALRPGVIDRVIADALETATSEKPIGVRVEAIRLLRLAPEDKTSDVLANLLEPREPVPVQLVALELLRESQNPKVGEVVIEHWKGFSPPVKREAAELLFSRVDRLKLLLDSVESKALTVTELEADRRKFLLVHPNSEIREKAKKLIGSLEQTDRARVITEFRRSLELAGDAQRGKAVYLSTCATCHRAEGQGKGVGPDLVTVANRSAEDLLIHILDPNREIAPVYVNYNIATTDGQLATGMIAEESGSSVTLKRSEGVTEVIPRKRVESIASTGQSLMPEGLEKGRTTRDFADLIAYIRGLKP